MHSELRSTGSDLSQREAEPKASNVAHWKRVVAEFQVSSSTRSLWQLANTLIPYAATWVGAYFALAVSWWLALPFAVLGGALLVRVFILFHDCTHGSLFRGRRANAVWGVVTGLLSFTSFHQWRWEHALHHATAGDLERRGVGDVWTMTVDEYLAASKWKRLRYRIVRNPVFLFAIVPVIFFVFLERLPNPKANARIWRWVLLTDLALVGVVWAMSSVFGFWNYASLQLVATGVASSSGVWLFYVQHQYEGTYWARGDWDYAEAALKGSSFYKLPAVLQWFSGSIGYHHVHHLSPRIPNYNLERCHRSDPMFEEVETLTLRSSLRLMHLRLWDERAGELIPIRGAAELERRSAS